jgi:hypothetical protein
MSLLAAKAGDGMIRQNIRAVTESSERIRLIMVGFGHGIEALLSVGRQHLAVYTFVLVIFLAVVSAKLRHLCIGSGVAMPVVLPPAARKGGRPCLAGGDESGPPAARPTSRALHGRAGVVEIAHGMVTGAYRHGAGGFSWMGGARLAASRLSMVWMSLPAAWAREFSAALKHTAEGLALDVGFCSTGVQGRGACR